MEQCCFLPSNTSTAVTSLLLTSSLFNYFIHFTTKFIVGDLSPFQSLSSITFYGFILIHLAFTSIHGTDSQSFQNTNFNSYPGTFFSLYHSYLSLSPYDLLCCIYLHNNKQIHPLLFSQTFHCSILFFHFLIPVSILHILLYLSPQDSTLVLLMPLTTILIHK